MIKKMMMMRQQHRGSSSFDKDFSVSGFNAMKCGDAESTTPRESIQENVIHTSKIHSPARNYVNLPQPASPQRWRYNPVT